MIIETEDNDHELEDRIGRHLVGEYGPDEGFNFDEEYGPNGVYNPDEEYDQWVDSRAMEDELSAMEDEDLYGDLYDGFFPEDVPGILMNENLRRVYRDTSLVKHWKKTRSFKDDLLAKVFSPKHIEHLMRKKCSRL